MVCIGKTDIGRRRTVNQDSFECTVLKDGTALAVICDGMGGAAGGGVAGSLACGVFTSRTVGEVPELLPEGELTRTAEKKIKALLCNAVSDANEAVYEKASSDGELRGMGTTLVASLYHNGTVFTVNVGDSRMYLVNGGAIRQITHDHSYVQYLVDSGRMTAEEARRSLNRNIITRAVGTDKEVTADVYVTHVRPGSDTLILLCSDGLTNHVSPADIADIIADSDDDSSKKKPYEARLDELIARANASGGSDNITAVLMSV